MSVCSLGEMPPAKDAPVPSKELAKASGGAGFWGTSVGVRQLWLPWNPEPGVKLGFLTLEALTAMFAFHFFKVELSLL